MVLVTVESGSGLLGSRLSGPTRLTAPCIARRASLTARAGRKITRTVDDTATRIVFVWGGADACCVVHLGIVLQ